MYILLVNIPPFDGTDENEIIKNVKAGIFELDLPEFKQVSPSAKSLVANLLQFESKQRLSARTAINHHWFKTFKRTSDKEIINHCLISLSKFDVT